MHKTQQIQCPIAQKAAISPDTIAIQTDSDTLTYTQCHQAIYTLQKQLRNYKIDASSTVAWTPKNTVFDALLFWALLRETAIAFPISHRLPTNQQEALYKTAHVTHIIGHDTDWYLETDHSHKKRKFIPQENLEAASQSPDELPDNLPPILLSPEALCDYTLTSGTTKAPKIAVHTINNHYQNALNANQILSVASNSHWLWSLPISHVSGLSILFRIFFAKGCLVISDAPLNTSLSSLPITHISLVPTQLYRLLQLDDTSWASNLDCILLGGAAVSTPLQTAAKKLPCKVFKSYGLTEFAAQVQIQDCENPDTYHPSHAQFKLDKDGHILIKSPCLFKGYLGSDQAIICDRVDNEWFLTSDHGKLLPTGHIQVLGRKDNLFISGGENIQPEEIETYIRSIDGIDHAIILPQSDPEFGARPIAIISPYTPELCDTIQATLASQLPKFKHPIHYHPWPNHIPKSDKLPRKLLNNWVSALKTS